MPEDGWQTPSAPEQPTGRQTSSCRRKHWHHRRSTSRSEETVPVGAEVQTLPVSSQHLLAGKNSSSFVAALAAQSPCAGHLGSTAVIIAADIVRMWIICRLLQICSCILQQQAACILCPASSVNRRATEKWLPGRSANFRPTGKQQ